MTGAEALAYPPDEPWAVEAAAGRCARLSAWVREVTAGLARDAASLAGAWDGPAAAAARQELRLVTALAESVVGPLLASGRLLRAHAAVVVEAREQVGRLRREYDELVAAQRRELLAVRAAVDVPAPAHRLALAEIQAAHAVDLGGLHARHHAVLAEVREHAARTSQQLVGLAREMLPAQVRHRGPLGEHEADLVALLPMLATSRRTSAVGSTPPPPGTPPWLARRWWELLTSDEQDRVVARFTTSIGGLDGLPAAVRSRANERLLDSDVAALRAKGTLSGEEARWLDNAVLVREQLALVREQLDPLTREPLAAQLLVFDPRAFDGAGRVAIAVGDLDAAGHVAFLVPGNGSEVGIGMTDLTGNAVRVTTEARRSSPTTETATVAWMGYDAPRSGDVAFDGAAERGADLLAADLLAVQAAREVLPHLTVVGHSYGSTTTGTALRDHVTGADDAVLVGSPGPGVETADELHVPDGHVFVGASSRDPVSYLDRFGADPTHEDFGAYRFQAEDITRHGLRLDPADHSKYFDAKTESLANVVAVVVGDYEALRPAAYRDEMWLLPDGINTDPEADREPTVVP